MPDALEQGALRYQRTYERMRRTAGARILRLWTTTGGLTEADAERFVNAAIPLMRGAETATARLTEAYFASVARDATGTPPPGTMDVAAIIGEALRGVDPADVYHRPVVIARTAIADGKTFEEAMRFAADRATQLAETDVVLTQRAAANEVLERDERFAGYRRVLTGKSCRLCALASTQRYHRSNLMPIHTHCDCGVAPIVGSQDPGQVINAPLLRALKDGDGARLEVHRHGELGPVLTESGHHFTGPSAI